MHLSGAYPVSSMLPFDAADVPLPAASLLPLPEVPPSAASIIPLDATNLHSPESGNRNPPPFSKADNFAMWKFLASQTDNK
jgi:hypothetical protein